MKNKKFEFNLKNTALIVVNALLLLAILATVIAAIVRPPREDEADNIKPTDKPDKLFGNWKEDEVIVQVTTLEEKLKEMGILVTQEYNFVQEETYTDKKAILLGFSSTSKVTFRYDGTITAGVDCTKIRIEKNESRKEVVITVPGAEILGTDIDFDSCQILEEKNGMWNKLTFADYNRALAEFKESAETRAKEKGILVRAFTSSKAIIERFIRTLLPEDEYTIVFR